MKAWYVKSEGITHEKQQELLDLAVDAGANGAECMCGNDIETRHAYPTRYTCHFTYCGVHQSETKLSDSSKAFGPDAVEMTYDEAWDYVTGIIRAKEEPASTEAVSPTNRSKPRNKYDREIVPGVHVDVYDVLNAFTTGGPEIDHGVKKLLAPGERGDKDEITDLEEAIKSIQRRIEHIKEWDGE